MQSHTEFYSSDATILPRSKQLADDIITSYLNSPLVLYTRILRLTINKMQQITWLNAFYREHV